MITQTITYQLNSPTPKDAVTIPQKTRQLLGKIPGTTLSVGWVIPQKDAPSEESSLIKMVTWPNREFMEGYLRHSFLAQWINEVKGREWRSEPGTIFSHTGESVVLPSAAYVLNNLEPLADKEIQALGWRKFSNAVALYAHERFSNPQFAGHLAHLLETSFEGGPLHLWDVVEVIIPPMVAVFVDDAGDCEMVTDLIRSKIPVPA